MPNSIASSTSKAAFANAAPVLWRLLRIASATLCVALAARISFPLPWTPVPFTLQPMAVLGVGLALGSVDGALAMVAYLAEGAAGFPVFSPTGVGGILQLFGPTGGFLLAYPAVAALCGGLTGRLRRRLSPFAAALAGCSAAMVILFLFGACWLAHEAHLTPARAWALAVLPFLPGEAIKVLSVAGTYHILKPFRSRLW